MSDPHKEPKYRSARDKFLGLSLESTRKSYYPQLKKQLEAARDNEQRLKLLFDKIPARIAYVNAQQRYVFVNREYENVFGLKCDQIIGIRVEDLFGPAYYANIKPYVEDALRGKYTRYESTLIDQTGQPTWLDVTCVPDIDSQGEVLGFYVLAVDMTAKKRAEEEKAHLEAKLRQAQKFEAIGTLAGGIAHDFNNLLMGIQGRASLMSVDLDASHPHMEHVQAIEEYIRSAVHLTKQLLGFARGGKYEVKPININELVRNSVTMFGRTRKEIKIHTKLKRSSPVVDVDGRQIEQVLLNMYVNAWQAMPDGGDLYLETRLATLDDVYTQPYDITPGRYAKVSVTDTGIGMDDATCQRVFDPFFTTKEKSRGTGLGLASAYGIIKNHGGIITVYSEVGQGTTFNIYLPVSDKQVRRDVIVQGKLIEGTETVLLVDDETMVINVGKAMLEKLGYRVMIANGGKQAIEMIEKEGPDIDLVILDLIMPGIDGGRTFDRIRAIQPEIPVVLSSGYAINGKAADIMRRGCNGFIQKPFNMSELSQKIRSVLDAAR